MGIYKFRNNPGISMVEMLVSVSLASIVYIVVGTLLASYVNHTTRGLRTDRFEETKSDLAFELTDRVRWGEEITVSADSINVDGTLYQKDAEGRFLRNNMNILADDIKINNFVVKNLSTDPEIVSLDIEFEITDRNSVSFDVMRLIVSQRRTGVVLE